MARKAVQVVEFREPVYNFKRRNKEEARERKKFLVHQINQRIIFTFQKKNSG